MCIRDSRSCIELLKDWGYEVVEGKIAIADIMAAAREGKLEAVSYTHLCSFLHEKLPFHGYLLSL